MVIGRYGRSETFVTHVDASWANDPFTNRSWFGYCLRWCGVAFCFRSKLLASVSLSSRDSEAAAAVFAVKAMLGFAILLRELRMVPGSSFKIFVDNKATVDGAHSDKVTKDSRHQAMRLAWLREVVKEGIIRMLPIGSSGNASDITTKILAGPTHEKLRRGLMGLDPNHSNGDVTEN